MDDYLEIDLRKLIKNILSRWFWIVIPAVLVGLAIFIYSYTRPVRFQTQANILLSELTYKVGLSSEMTTIPPGLPSKEAITRLLLNDNITATLFDLWDCDPYAKENYSLKKFRDNKLAVNVGLDGSLYSLIVQGECRENTALLANTWADLAIREVNTFFYGFDTEQEVYFTDQVAKARLALDQAETDLMTFTEVDPRVGLSNQLDALTATQRESLTQIRSLETAKEDLLNLVAQLDAEPDDAPLDPMYRFSLILIQMRVYSGLNWESSPIQVLVDFSEVPEAQTVGGFKAMLETTLGLIDARVENLNQDQAALTPRISALQAEIMALDNEELALRNTHNRLQMVYELLAIKLEEVNLSITSNKDSGVIIISRATTPEPGDRLPRNTVRNTAIGGLAAGFMGLAGVVLADWWKAPEEKSEEDVLE